MHKFILLEYVPAHHVSSGLKMRNFETISGLIAVHTHPHRARHAHQRHGLEGDSASQNASMQTLRSDLQQLPEGRAEEAQACVHEHTVRGTG